MNVDQLIGRMAVLEIVATTSLQIYLSSLKDPDSTVARELVDQLRLLVEDRTKHHSAEARAEAAHYADQLFSEILEDLALTREQ